MGETTRILPFGEDAIAEAARLIAEGRTVAIATETVYGLAADATNAEAVARIYEAKGRPNFNPLIVHVPDLPSAERIGEFSAAARKLAEQHWPGPLTLVVPLREDASVAGLVTAGLSTIAIRVPAHPAMQALLRATGHPLAAPSANASGSISPTRAKHVQKSLGGRIPLIVDAGPTERGLESTIVAASGGQLRLLSATDPRQRGSHLAYAHPNGYAVMRALIDRGVIGDFRAPDILRFGFAPLYTRYEDVWHAVATLRDVLHTQCWSEPRYAVRAAVT